MEKEALAVIWSVLRLKQLLLGRHFTLVTDNGPLVAIYGGVQLPKVASSRMVRWAIILQAYDFSIVHKPGSEIPHADAISRLRWDDDEDNAEDRVINNISDNSLSCDLRETIRCFIKDDSTASEVIKRIQANSWTNCSQRMRAFAREKQHLTVERGLINFGHRLYIPPQMRKDIFNEAHELHSGISSTLRRVSLNAWWPGMKKDISTWVGQCNTCSHIRPRVAHDNSTWPTTTQPFERIHGDWAYIQDIGNVLLLVDSFSGWIEATLCKNRSAESVINALVNLVSRFGAPKCLVTDNGAEFTSEAVNTWCSANGIQKTESPPYHSESNGQAERAVQTVKKSLKAWKINKVHMPFEAYLARILFHQRACFKRRDGKTPAECVFGRQIRVPLSAVFAFGERVVYKPRRDLPASSSTFLMERGSNTSWLLDEAGTLTLAHSNQIAPAPPLPVNELPRQLEDEISTQRYPGEISAAVQNPPAAAAVQPIDDEPTGPRRSQRVRTPRTPTDYEDL